MKASGVRMVIFSYWPSDNRSSSMEHQRRPDMQQAPLDIIPAAWRCLVLPHHDPAADRRRYMLWTVAASKSLRRRDIFVSRSERWGDPRVKLMQGAQWEAMRPQNCRALGRSGSPEPELQLKPVFHDEGIFVLASRPH